ncbi:AAA family ATPase [Proteus columbae]|uniref:AAA family ATPase n=1 Tax=Proteus columbae TaxID=1987580 RepID=UPI00288AC986|nr:AAA family ATPase [Proteus columbae]
MLESLEIENFKAFSNKQKLKLSPITLIYGPNSSGKSSLIQSIMMLKQSILSKNKDGVVITSGDSIGLGDFKSLVNSQNEDKKIFLSLHYKNNHNAQDYMQKFSRKMLFSNNDSRNLNFIIGFQKVPYIEHYNFNCIDKNNKNNKNNIKINIDFDKVYHTSQNNDYVLRESGYLKFSLLNRHDSQNISSDELNILNRNLSSLFKSNSRINFPTEPEKSLFILNDYMEKIVDDIEHLFNNILYLGPLRSSPKRFYSADISNYQKGQGKKNLGMELFNASKEVKEKVNDLLSKFNIPYVVDAKDIGNYNTGTLISIQLTDIRNNAVITPKDVGFGIGQVLPIILESVIASNKTLCIEQPEIHLHPKLQADLADLFIDSIMENGNQWIIETHSESLMLRIQRRIREKKLSKDKVSVLYVDIGEFGAQVTELPLDDDGDFMTEWPNGFFEERLNELFGNE